MISLILFLSIITPPGETDAMEAFAGGDIYLVTFGRPSAVVFRDSVTGIRFQSLGCVVRDGDIEYQNEWNDFMLNLWNYLGSDSTFFFIGTETEAIDYAAGECIYRDQWGSVPIVLYPEELAHIVWLATGARREGSELYARLVVGTPLWDDTLSTTVTAGTDVLRELFQRGREQIRTNQPD